MCEQKMPGDDVARQMADELIAYKTNLSDTSAVMMRLMMRFNPLTILAHCAKAVEIAQAKARCAADKISDELRRP
jgi:hypothetical protein